MCDIMWRGDVWWHVVVYCDQWLCVVECVGVLYGGVWCCSVSWCCVMCYVVAW